MNLAEQIAVEIEELLRVGSVPGEPVPSSLEVALLQALATYRLTQAVMAVAERLDYPLRRTP